MKIKFMGFDQRLLILQYHKVPQVSNIFPSFETNAKDFYRAILFLSRWFNFFPLNEAVTLLRENRLPILSAVLTFDDGYSDWMDSVVPVLKRLNIPATFFITSSQLGKSEPFWHERIAHALLAREIKNLDSTTKSTAASSGAMANRILELQEQLKYKTLCEREDAIAKLEEGLPKNDAFRPFTVSDVIRLRDAGFQIGGHSKNHPILTRCSLKEAIDEIAGCKEELESILRDPVTQFAYPNGRPQLDFSKEHIELVRQAGYRLAVSTAPGMANIDTDIFQLPRFTPWARSNWRCALQILRNTYVTPLAVSDE